MYEHNIHICLGSSCFSRGNEELLEFIKEYLRNNDLKEETCFRGHLCSGECKCGPNINIDGQEYHNVKIETIEKLLDSHFSKKTVTEQNK